MILWLRISLLFLTVYALLISLANVSVVIAVATERIYYADLEHIEIPYHNTKYIAFIKPSSRRYSRRDPYYYLSMTCTSLVPFGRNVLGIRACEDHFEHLARVATTAADCIYLKINTAALHRNQINSPSIVSAYGLSDPSFVFVLPRSHPLDLYFYEFLSNEYRRSFVEVHLNVCDLILKDKVFGGIIRKRFTGSTGVLKTCPFPADVYHLANASIQNMPILATFPFQKCRLYANLTWHHPNGTKELMASGHLDVLIKSKWRQ